ncbi:fimbria/pilus outer membrane usher protein [Gilvimarinus polysaccharolyticus]|uniref:fimbria/pilus outer membrane usher protein n=1 Tax=Gilvimarinus polysaccharolyticus TaxID=863921 RepID=UPI00067388F4|nr:fimbria/pilus outer membrane usher protein [Gilvimarinus polysaccharolyticus]
MLTADVFGEQYLTDLETHHFSHDVSDYSSQADITLYLEVILNQTRYPRLLPIIQRNHELFAKVGDLQQLGFIVNDAVGTDNIALSSLAGLKVNYLVSTQQLKLTAPLSLLSLPVTTLWADSSQNAPKATASPGVLFNYDLYFNQDNKHRLASAATEFRIFGFGNGVFSHTSTTHAEQAEDSSWESKTVALDTFGEWSFPENATRLVIGDSISGGLNWSRSLRFGGIQFSRSFKLQPYRTTSPLASFIGKATLPSSVELYIDGIRRYQSNVPTGPFELNSAPKITGTGQAQVVTTDILGRSTTIDIPFYSTQQLLAKGLSDWTVNVGVAHKDYGVRSFSYGDEPSATGSIRYGLNNQLTMEGHAETGGRLINGGIGAVWQPGLAGVISLAHTHSDENGKTGHQTAWRYSWNNSRFNFSAASQRTFGNYRDLATHYGPLPSRLSEQVLASLYTPHLGNIGISATRFDYSDSNEPLSRYAGVYWSHNIGGRVSLNLSYNQNLNDSKDCNLQFGINVSFNRDYQLSTTAQRHAQKNNYQASLQRTLPSDGGSGWRLQTGKNKNATNASAQGNWLGNYGRIDAGIAHTEKHNTGYAQASGSLVLMNNQGFASRRINDGFAVVSTDGISNMPVKLENRLIGYTNDSGNLLVSRLNTWQRNRLSVDPMDLPADNTITIIDKIVTPSDRAGTLVQFSIEKVRAATVILTDINGQPLPIASQVQQTDGSDKLIFVGFDGQAYIQKLQDHNQLRVITPNGICHVEFDIPKNEKPSSYIIGPFKCLEAAQ